MVIYVKELDNNDKLEKIDKFPKLIQKIIKKYTEVSNNFYKVHLNEQTEKIIIPNLQSKRVYKNILKKLKKDYGRKKIELVLSEQTYKYKYEFDELKIIEGKNIILNNIHKVIEKIIDNNPIETIDIYILANNYTQENVNVVKNVASKVKSVNVITRQIEKYKTIEEILLEKGLLISISNNKRKSLKNAKIIINLDFDKEEISKFNIYRNACIINVKDEKIINNLHGFDGVIVQKIDVKIPNNKLAFFKENNLYDKYRKIELFESIKDANEQIEIENLYGKNGKIEEKELINIQKILTN